jgi:4-amino-4-deoxy-L-arabinose transferase-like glycosyltransferase
VPGAPLVILTVLAAVVRFATLDAQSFWYDEALTVDLVNRSFGDMLDGVFEGQAQPPPYFILAWLWAKAFGVGEIGLRSLSALLGTLTVPVAYAAAQIVAGRRVAIATGLLTALSPALVWYSQEARAYALVTFLCAAALLLFLRALERPTGRDLALWAVASLVAVASHYFALFAVLPQAAWLLWRCADRRLAVRAVGGLGAGLVVIAPMLLYQREHGGAEWISDIPLDPRLRDVVYTFVAGPTGIGPLTGDRGTVFVVGLVVAAVTIALALVWSEPPVRRRVLLVLGVAASVIALPLAGTLAGVDYVLDRNLLPALVPLTIVVAAGLCVRPLRIAGPLIAAVVALGFAAVVVAAVPRNPERQRDDWRSVAELVGPAREDRVFVVSPYWQFVTLQTYLPRAEYLAAPRRVTKVITIELEAFVPFGDQVTTIAPPPPFRETLFQPNQNFTVVEYTAPEPVLIDPAALSGAGPNRGEPFFEPAEGR